MFTADMWDAEKLTRMARELQPGILLNNRASVPGDFDTPEQRLGFFQDWRPWESCICLTNSWSYSGGEPKSRDQLIQMLVANACSPGNRSGTACSRASAETFFRVSSFEL